MTVQVAKVTELVFLMYIRLFLSARRAHALATIHTPLALRAVISLGPCRRFDLFAPFALDRRGPCRSSQAIGAKAVAVYQEPPKSTADTTVGFGLFSVAALANCYAEQDRPSHLVTAITRCLSSYFEIWLAQIAYSLDLSLSLKSVLGSVNVIRKDLSFPGASLSTVSTVAVTDLSSSSSNLDPYSGDGCFPSNLALAQ